MSLASSRLGRPPLQGPEGRTQDRLNNVERQPPNWRGIRSDDNGPLRIIRGEINTTTPTITRGGGFTLTRNGVGDVTINFNTAFSANSTPTAIAGGSSRVVYCTGTGTGSCRLVLAVSTTGAAVDGDIFFQVVGPA